MCRVLKCPLLNNLVYFNVRFKTSAAPLLTGQSALRRPTPPGAWPIEMVPPDFAAARDSSIRETRRRSRPPRARSHMECGKVHANVAFRGVRRALSQRRSRLHSVRRLGRGTNGQGRGGGETGGMLIRIHGRVQEYNKRDGAREGRTRRTRWRRGKERKGHGFTVVCLQTCMHKVYGSRAAETAGSIVENQTSTHTLKDVRVYYSSVM